MNRLFPFVTLVERGLRRPHIPLCIAAVLFIVSCVFASRLEFEASYSAMIPPDEIEVAESAKLLGTLESTQALTVVVIAEREVRLDFARRAAANLMELDEVLSVDVEYPVAAFEKRWFATLPAAQREELATLITDAARRALRVQSRFFVELRDDDPWEPVEQAIKRLQAAHGVDAPALRERTWTTRDGASLLVSVRPRVTMLTPIGDYQAIIAAIEKAIAVTPGADTVKWSLSGQMLVALDEYQLIRRDLAAATLLALLLVIALLTLVSRRLSTIPILAAALALGLAMTLALTWVTLGRLNVVSGFMLPALVGLGVDFCIHVLAAYEQALHRQAPRAAMITAVQQQLRPCAIAAATTAAGFLALLLCRFDGLSEYGIIAGLGVFAMYGACFLVLPPLATALIRAPRVVGEPRGFPQGFPRVLVPVSLLLVCSTLGLGAARFHNDFAVLRGPLPNDASHAMLMQEYGGPFEPTLLGVRTASEARQIAALARARQGGGEATAVGRVVALTDFLPHPTWRPGPQSEMLDALTTLRSHGNPVERMRLDVMTAWARGEPWAVDDLPESLQRALRPDDETWLIAVYSRMELHAEDQFRDWRDQLREIRVAAAADDIAFQIADKWSIVTKMIELIREAIAPMLAAAFALVSFVLVVTRRRGQRIIPVIGAVVLGAAAGAGLAGWLDVPFNIFNIVVLPAVFGIGVDNAVQMSDVLATAPTAESPEVRARMGACALSSATTAIGFGAMLVADHPGIASLGTVALLGIVATFAASTLGLPSLLMWWARRAGKR